MRTWRSTALAMVLLAACSSAPADTVSPSTDAPPPTTSVPPTSDATTPSTTDDTLPPDHGPVRVAQPSWDSALVYTSIAMSVLEELGFEPESVDRDGPHDGLQSLVDDDADLFFGLWHGDHQLEHWGAAEDAAIVSTMVPAGGFEGWLISKAWADEHNITSLDRVADDPELALALDTDGNGRGEIFGCPQEWRCFDIANSYLDFNDWSLLEHFPPWAEVNGGPSDPEQEARTREEFTQRFNTFLERARNGEPGIAYVWTPTSHHANADVGTTTMWLSVSHRAIHTGARNPWEGGPWRDIVRDDGTLGFTALLPEHCTQGPDGCQTGWPEASDINIAGRLDWIDEHPDAARVLGNMIFTTTEISEFVRAIESLELTDRAAKLTASDTIAEAWIEANRERVDAWMSR